MCTDVLGQKNNGTTIAALNLAEYLKSRGHNVRIICPEGSQAPGFDCYLLPHKSLFPFDKYVEKNGVVIAKAKTDVIEKAIKDADVVHCMTPLNASLATCRQVIKEGKPLTAGFHCQAENITAHIFLKNFAPANHIAYKIMYDKLYKYCDAIHFPTQFIKDVFESEVHRNFTCGRVISNGVNSCFRHIDARKPAEFKDKFVILFTGRYAREKSHEILIKAVSESRHVDDIQLIFAGKGPLEAKLRKMSAHLLKNQPVFGFYSRDELVNVINYADLYCHPAEIEIEAISCLEAIACGLVPVISDSPKSATRYFALDERNSFKYNDPADLAAKIDYWIEHPSERAECSRTYAGYSAQFDFDKCMREMEKMLLDACESHCKKSGQAI